MSLLRSSLLFVFYMATTATHVTAAAAAARFMEIQEGKNHPLEGLTPKNVGDFHNRVMRSVDKRMRAADLPTDYESFNSIVEEEMKKASCFDDDVECHDHVRKSVQESNERVRTHKGLTIAGSLADFDLLDVLPMELPDNTRDAFVSIHDALSQLNQDDEEVVLQANVDNVVGSIQDIVDKVEANEDIDEPSKMAIVGAASVAIGSTKYWTGALEDKDNSFRRLQEYSAEHIENSVALNTERDSREMEGLFRRMVDIMDIILADFIGAVVGSIDPLIDYIFSGGIASPLPIAAGIFFTSALDSIAATGLIIPAVSTIVRCFLEDLLLTAVNCSIADLFCSDTTICDFLIGEKDLHS